MHWKEKWGLNNQKGKKVQTNKYKSKSNQSIMMNFTWEKAKKRAIAKMKDREKIYLKSGRNVEAEKLKKKRMRFEA